jgi:hypothetical protein
MSSRAGCNDVGEVVPLGEGISIPQVAWMGAKSGLARGKEDSQLL